MPFFSKSRSLRHPQNMWCAREGQPRPLSRRRLRCLAGCTLVHFNASPFLRLLTHFRMTFTSTKRKWDLSSAPSASRMPCSNFPPACSVTAWVCDGLDYNWEPNFQWGTFGSASIRAWSLSTETGFTFDRIRFHPRPLLRADVYSGDGNPANQALGTFNPLFPRGAYFTPAVGTPLSERMAPGKPRSWNRRSKAGKASSSRLDSSASHSSRQREE
jgi:Alginate export